MSMKRLEGLLSVWTAVDQTSTIIQATLYTSFSISLIFNPPYASSIHRIQYTTGPHLATPLRRRYENSRSIRFYLVRPVNQWMGWIFSTLLLDTNAVNVIVIKHHLLSGYPRSPYRNLPKNNNCCVKSSHLRKNLAK